MGEPALRALTGLSGITGNRGKVLYYAENTDIRILPTFNPAFVLRRPGIQPVVESDLLFAKQLLGEEINKVDVSYEGLETLDQVSAFFERIRDIPEIVVDLEPPGSIGRSSRCAASASTTAAAIATTPSSLSTSSGATAPKNA